MDLRGKKVAVVGLGRSGVVAANLLLEKGAKVSITDCLDNQKIRENVHTLKNKKNIISIETGRHTEDLIKGQNLVVVSPGVPLDSLPVLWAKKRNIPVIGEIELAFAACCAPIIAITGTNGKTTVTTLLGQIFKDAGRKCVVCGNIGNPFSAEVARISNEHVVILEVSSFQLETIDKFKPKVAVVLNVTCDHLDRHADLGEYVRTKCRIFTNQNEEDWAVLNGKDPYKDVFALKTNARVLYFGKNKDLGKSIKYLNDNHLAALSISSLFNIPEKTAIDACRYFKGIEHRMEEVAQIREVKFINDSKATNVDSTLWALNSIERPVILIAGGRDKGSDFSPVREKFKDKVRAVVLLGEAKEKIKGALGDLVVIKNVGTIKEAVKEAFNLAEPGDCVLLSPMCASFDMFKDYEERGRVFKEEVHNLNYRCGVYESPYL